MAKRIAVDFDGTITEDSPYPIMGKLRKHCKETLNELTRQGYSIMLWTCRTGPFLTEAIDFIKANNLPITIPDSTPGKIEADIYIDDRNPWNKPIDWQEIERSILMTKLPNTEKVKEIVMKPSAITKCQIGQDWFKSEFEIHFLPGEYYPDYMEVAAYIMKEIDGQELNIEQAARLIFDHLMLYRPNYLKVISHITGCKSHFDVDVTIE